MGFATETYTLKGMRQDDSDLLFNGSKDALSFAFENYNLRFLADESGTLLAATQEKGNERVSVLFYNEFFLDPADFYGAFYRLDYLPFKVVGQAVVDKYLVLFGKCEKTSSFTNHDGTQYTFMKDNDIVMRIEKSSDGNLYAWLLYDGQELDFRPEMPLETLPHVETDIVKKVYFTDGVHGPRSVNVVNKDAGNIANINLGYSLELEDVFSVNKEHSVVGNYPIGKVRFFYTYFNDTYSETPVVDWSPFFDCAYKNQGGSPDSGYKTQYAFRVNIANTDSKFKFVRIYFQHFTSNDASVYTLKYIERPVTAGNISVVVKFDQEDAKNSTKTYLDLKVSNTSFIPYTLAEKDGRMFYGNIKISLPDTSDIDFSGTASVMFVDKKIGFEDLDVTNTYKYKPDNTTFAGSNYEYMGFRKDNWYRFGFIAQHKNGEWSNVFFVADAQCDKTSRTEVIYEKIPSSIQPVGTGNNTTYTQDGKPLRSEYYIPKAKLVPTALFKQKLQKLYDAGFRRIKPVCVVPPYGLRNIITQGISCSTIYTGDQRRNVTRNNGLFAMPSYFFRPMPLYEPNDTLVDGYIFKADYPYTIRDVGDLKISKNIKIEGPDGGWILNPDFTDEKYARYNSAFREYRHGFSLPPKDRINAELQSSDFSINDYFYRRATNGQGDYEDSPLFGNVNLFSFKDRSGKIYFRNINGINNYAPDYDSENWFFALIGQYGVLPWHNLYTTGYDNTVFIDESFCTLNTPEVDYDFSRQVEPWFMDCDIEVVGYAQVTGSMANIDIAETKFEMEPSGMVASDATKDKYKVTGTCLHDIALKHQEWLDNETLEYIENMAATKKMPSNPFTQLCGPWWLDTMMVASFQHSYNENTGGAVNENNDVADHDNERIFPNLTFSNTSAQNPSLYSLYEQDSLIDPTNKHLWFVRGFDKRLNPKNKSFRWTPAFYGETLKNLNNGGVTYIDGKAVYPYSEGKNNSQKRIGIFSDFTVKENFNADYMPDVGYMLGQFNKLGNIPFTWNTIYLTENIHNDGYWDLWDKNRRNLEYGISALGAGIVILPYSCITPSSLYDPYVASEADDFRGLFTYYFNPLHGCHTAAFYQMPQTDETRIRIQRLNHPFLLPNKTDYNNRDWQIRTNNWLYINAIGFQDYEDLNEDGIYFNGSEYGCHYYAPYSTNFTGAYFDPYYAHVVYPFMTQTNTPFCGSNDIYRNDGANHRPAYNSTNSCLYSSCTNYVDIAVDGNKKTYSAYYHAPLLTQELRAEPQLSRIPFLNDTSITKLYSYNCSDSASEANVPVLQHRTYTLTAAMKWYRGFKSLKSTGKNTEALVSTGSNMDKKTLMGDLPFSGFLPQFFTHSGLLVPNDPNPGDNTGYHSLSSYRAVLGNLNGQINYGKTKDDNDWAEELADFIANESPQLIQLDYMSTPHIVYYCQNTAGNSLSLLTSLYMTSPLRDITGSSGYGFMPQYYWKEFVNELYAWEAIGQGGLPSIISDAQRWVYSTYPHCGHFEEFMFDALAKAVDGQPYWNNGNTKKLPLYPAQTERRQIRLGFDTRRFVAKDNYGEPRKAGDYWVLPISNIYNSKLISQTGGGNPYTFEDVSVENWDWKMCGYTVRISDILSQSLLVRDRNVEYLEGDTYFQRYNCFKTVSKDTMFSMTFGNESNDDEATPGVNDVTETASVMIESYMNLDGLYWDYDNLTDRKTSPLVHPFWNNMKQINPVYSIQNDICDTFKVVDRNYYNSELTHYPTMILWSVQKHDGEVEDSFGIVPVTNRMLVSGECGDINMLLNYGNKVFCLQEHGLSVLNWNPQVIQPTTTDSTMSIYLSDSTRLQDVVYVSRTTGTKNKWSVAVGQRGFYWMDETLHNISGYLGEGIADITTANGFKSWASKNITAENPVWDANTFMLKKKAFKASADIESGDFYWMDGTQCLCFNEQLACFTSFYGYHYTPYKFNWLDKRWSVINDVNGKNNRDKTAMSSSLWHDQCNYTHTLYDKDVDAYIDLLVNPAGQYDKVFNFVEYNAEAYLPGESKVITHFNPWNRISVSNMYQLGSDDLSKINTKERFRLWRTSLPREIKDGKATLNRIRSPWCRIRLSHIGLKGHNVDPSTNEYIDKLYYINVNYTLPEQPQKTNIRQ